MNMTTRIPDAEAVKAEILEKYPAKVAKKRSKSMVVNDPETVPAVQANVRTIPGIISQRGCCYAGCKGVVLGPTRDIINITHGPIGCGFYSWLTRRNQTDPGEVGPNGENFMMYCFSTDMQDENIVFGGEKKLRAAIQEAYDIFHPKAIAIFATCPVGLIGDDIHAIAREMKEKFGDCNVFGFSCEGYKGVSQSAGHHIANNQIFKHVIGRGNTRPDGKYVMNMLGEYNIGGDAFELERLLESCGITLNASFNYVADMIEKKYGIPWFKVNFIGAESTAKSLRKIAQYFEDPALAERVETVIAEEMAAVKAVADEIRPRTEGKLAMLFVGGSRAHHYQDLFRELGMKSIAAGYEFAHRDDYEGRRVLPTIQVDADSRNIEELHVEKDPALYDPRKSTDEMQTLAQQGYEFNDYNGMMTEMEKGALVIDDISHYEMERLIEAYHPAVFCAGIKEKYCVQKMGVPMKQLHSYDYGGPYAGFRGAINFYRDIDRMVNAKVWKLIRPPWLDTPQIVAEFASA